MVSNRKRAKELELIKNHIQLIQQENKIKITQNLTKHIIWIQERLTFVRIMI